MSWFRGAEPRIDLNHPETGQQREGGSRGAEGWAHVVLPGATGPHPCPSRPCKPRVIKTILQVGKLRLRDSKPLYSKCGPWPRRKGGHRASVACR